MHLTCFGNIVLIAILVVLALFLIGLGGAVGSYFESKDRSGLAILTMSMNWRASVAMKPERFGALAFIGK